MKKFIVVVLVLGLIFAMSACSNSSVFEADLENFNIREKYQNANVVKFEAYMKDSKITDVMGSIAYDDFVYGFLKENDKIVYFDDVTISDVGDSYKNNLTFSDLKQKLLILDKFINSNYKYSDYKVKLFLNTFNIFAEEIAGAKIFIFKAGKIDVYKQITEIKEPCIMVYSLGKVGFNLFVLLD